MLAINDLPVTGLPQHIRSLDVRRDLSTVADLIEIAFSAYMDVDGREYLRQLRRMAQDPYTLRWSGGYLDRGPASQGGLVWEENGRVVGNLSLIPHYDGTQRIFLIANVAVHPDFRGRGIGKALTQAALDQIRRSGVRFARLQVREDNPVAHGLYQHLGFRETARRTTWISASPLPVTHDSRISIYHCRPAEWHTAEKWMYDLYPRQVTWNLPLTIARLRPGLFYDLARIFSGERIRQWSIRKDGILAGVLTWQASALSSDLLWLAASPENEWTTITTLLPHVHRLASPARPLSANYPAGRAAAAFMEAGFKSLHTLVWMEYDLGG